MYVLFCIILLVITTVREKSIYNIYSQRGTSSVHSRDTLTRNGTLSHNIMVNDINNRLAK